MNEASKYILFNLVAFALLATPWFVNLHKLVSCDFESDYRCEITHGIGVVLPPASYITVWFDDDNS